MTSCTSCDAPVNTLLPLAPVVCPNCALWRLAGRALTLYRARGRSDVYFITPDDDEAMPTAPTLRLMLDDGTGIVTVRLRCLGLAPGWFTGACQNAIIAPTSQMLGVR